MSLRYHLSDFTRKIVRCTVIDNDHIDSAQADDLLIKQLC